MKNNILVLILIIGLLVLGFLYYKEKSTPDSFDNNFTNTEINTENTGNNNVPSNSNPSTSTGTNTQNQTVYVRSSQFGLYYPSSFEVTEYMDGSTLYLYATNGNAVISYGGQNSSCMPDGNEFGEFVYGVSTTTCLRGLRAQIGLENVRATLSSEELKLFGDFVLKNR